MGSLMMNREAIESGVNYEIIHSEGHVLFTYDTRLDGPKRYFAYSMVLGEKNSWLDKREDFLRLAKWALKKRCGISLP